MAQLPLLSLHPAVSTHASVGALVGPNVSPTFVGLAVTGADVGLEDGAAVGAHVCPSVVGDREGAAVLFRGPPTGFDVGDALGAVVPPPARHTRALKISCGGAN